MKNILLLSLLVILGCDASIKSSNGEYGISFNEYTYQTVDTSQMTVGVRFKEQNGAPIVMVKTRNGVGMIDFLGEMQKGNDKVKCRIFSKKEWDCNFGTPFDDIYSVMQVHGDSMKYERKLVKDVERYTLIRK